MTLSSLFDGVEKSILNLPSLLAPLGADASKVSQ